MHTNICFRCYEANEHAIDLCCQSPKMSGLFHGSKVLRANLGLRNETQLGYTSSKVISSSVKYINIVGFFTCRPCDVLKS